MKTRQFIYIAILFVLSVATVLTSEGCHNDRKPDAKPNLIMISIDTLRRDHLGCYGYWRNTSPHIDRLAEQGVIFDNAVSASSWTLPSHTSMLTGLYPSFHGLEDDGVTLSPKIETLAEKLNEMGYWTVGVISHIYVSSAFNLNRGFQVFDDSMIDEGSRNPIAEEVVDRTLEIMTSQVQQPYYLFVHFFDPHWDYTPPAPYDEKFTSDDYEGSIDGTLPTFSQYVDGRQKISKADLRRLTALYDGEIAYVDAQIGRMLDELRQRGLMDNTTVALTSDHGEEFKDHGRLGHAISLFRELVGVPFIISGHDAFPSGERRKDIVSPVDIFPTLLDLAGYKGERTTQGISLVESVISDQRPVFAESIRYGNEKRTVRQGRFKLIHNIQGDNRYYFDVVNDPKEKRPFKKDPTGGDLVDALNDFALTADAGWHLKLIALKPGGLKFQAAITTEGKFVNPRRYHSEHLTEPSKAVYTVFEVSPDKKILNVEAEITYLMSEITFRTDPPDASVTFDISAESPGKEAGVFLGDGYRINGDEPFSLVRSDTRLNGLPDDYTKTPTGCYIRTIIDPNESSARSNMSEGAVQRLKALGYIDQDDNDDALENTPE